MVWIVLDDLRVFREDRVPDVFGTNTPLEEFIQRVLAVPDFVEAGPDFFHGGQLSTSRPR